MPRKFLTSSVVELEAIANKVWNEVRLLGEVAEELTHRSTGRARKLASAVEARLVALGIPQMRQDARGNTNSASSSGELEQLRAIVESLQNENTELAKALESERQLSKARETRKSILSEWGLTDSCPDFVVTAAYRAWMKKLNPDAHAGSDAAHKKELTEKFQILQRDFADFKARAAS
jgi:hypothetical protein